MPGRRSRTRPVFYRCKAVLRRHCSARESGRRNRVPPQLNSCASRTAGVGNSSRSGNRRMVLPRRQGALRGRFTPLTIAYRCLRDVLEENRYQAISVPLARLFAWRGRHPGRCLGAAYQLGGEVSLLYDQPAPALGSALVAVAKSSRSPSSTASTLRCSTGRLQLIRRQPWSRSLPRRRRTAGR